MRISGSKVAAVNVPAPVGGWNARDDLAGMKPTDAVILKNWRPRPGRLEVRGGSVGPFNTIIIGPLDTPRPTTSSVTSFPSLTGEKLIYAYDEKLFVYSPGGGSRFIYDGAGDSVLNWDFAQFQDRMICVCDDASVPARFFKYDKDAPEWPVPLIDDLNITSGPTAESLIGVCVYKGRAYYWTADSQSFWYAAAGSFQGNLSEFDLGSALRIGGKLTMMVSLTVDGGGGQDDLACFIFSTGEVLVYQGSDPGDAADWELVGSFQIGPPVNSQAHCKLAGTELVLTKDGIVDLAAALKLGRFGESADFSSKITQAVTDAVKQFGDLDGWQLIHVPAEHCIILNIPLGGGDYKQYVLETDTGGWWECVGFNTQLGVFRDRIVGSFVFEMIEPYEALTVQTFNLFEAGAADVHHSSSPSGQSIDATALPAFSTLGSPADRKQLTAVKPFTNIGNGIPTITGRADFDVTIPAAPASLGEITNAQAQPVISTFATGNYISHTMQVSKTTGEVQWNASTLFFERGGPV